ncbi:MAG TPA: PAS domain S-box protein [Allocoleopsis sp.]
MPISLVDRLTQLTRPPLPPDQQIPSLGNFSLKAFQTGLMLLVVAVVVQAGQGQAVKPQAKTVQASIAQSITTEKTDRQYHQAIQQAQTYRFWLYILSGVVLVGLGSTLASKLKAMQSDEERFRNIFENSQIGIFRTRVADGLLLAANQRFINMFGFEHASEVIGTAYSTDFYVDPEVRLRAIEALHQYGEVQNVEVQFYRRDKSTFWGLYSARLNAEAGYMEGVIADNTDRKLAEEALRHSEAIYRAINEALPDLLIRMKRDGTFVDVKEPSSDDLPLIKPISEMIGQNVRNILPADAAQKRLEAAARALDTGKAQIYEVLLEIQHQPRWQETRIVPLSSDEVLVVVRDITTRKQAEADLKAQQAFLRQVIDVVPSSIFVKDRQGRFLTANKAAAAMYGITVEAMLGKHDLDLNLDPAQVEASQHINEAVMSTLKPKLIPNHNPMFRPDSEEPRYYQTIISPFINDKGEVKGIIGSASDITNLKQVEEELRHAKEAAETANRAKSQFLSNMSHELRTPLNIILGFTQLMARSGSLNPQQQGYLDTISRSGEHLLMLINDVLEMSKIEAGRVTLNETDVDLPDLLASLQQMLQLKAESKGLQLFFTPAIDLPRYIHTDESKLRQILMNLLGNAIKFTQTGSVHLRINWENREASMAAGTTLAPYSLIFEVEDTGPGIAPTELEHLFEPFVQTETGVNSNEGTGLGLAISHRFVQLMGGSMTVDSQVGVGTLFRFDIQTQIVESEVIQPASRHYHQVIGLAAEQPTYRILVAEDKLANRQLLLELLVPVGFEVQEAVNGQEAIDLWQSWNPHLIWMDIRMPVMDGYEATRQIKSSGLPAPIILALTGSAFEEDRVKALSIGCDDFVRKPVRAEVIFEKMAEFLGVQYIYKETDQHNSREQSSKSSSTEFVLSTDSFSTLPVDWVQQLHQAATRVNSKQIQSLVQEIQPEHPQLAEALTRLVDNFSFEEIIELTAPQS